MKWLDRIPLPIVALFTVPLAMAPFPFRQEVHLFEKTVMLINGNLVAIEDIGDIFIHGIPAVVLIIKLLRVILMNKSSNSSPPSKEGS